MMGIFHWLQIEQHNKIDKHLHATKIVKQKQQQQFGRLLHYCKGIAENLYLTFFFFQIEFQISTIQLLQFSPCNTKKFITQRLDRNFNNLL